MSLPPTHIMEQTCSIIKATQNKYGDQVLDSTEEIKCRFRWITELQHVSNREELQSDALLWTAGDENIDEGTIIKFDGEYFRVMRVTEARRLRGDTVYFKKCLMNKYAGGIEDGN